MATPAEVTALKEASGLPADRMFLQLMIEHHQGAVEMADGILARSDDDTVTALANAILRSQNSEIALLEGMLAELPAD